MADGLNFVRSTRILELVEDYRNIQAAIANIRASPSAEEYNEEAYVLLRACVAQAQQLLAHQYPILAPGGQGQTTAEMKRVMLDISARRFRAQQIYLRASAALRAIGARIQLLHGQRPTPVHAGALMALRNQLRAELATITDARIYAGLHERDAAMNRWLEEEPPLQAILQYSTSG